MSSTSPHHETKLVTIPVTTSINPESQKEYKRLGTRGWALRRGYSDSSTSKLKILQESMEKADLSQLFSCVDEECAVIEHLSNQNSQAEKKNCAICWKPNERCNFDPDDTKWKEKSRSKKLRNQLIIVLILSLIPIVLSPPILTFLFARTEWGPIVLRAGSPSLTWFWYLIFSPIICIGVTIYFAFRAVLAYGNGRPLLMHGKKAAFELGAACLVGGALAAWLAIWLFPLVKHA